MPTVTQVLGPDISESKETGLAITIVLNKDRKEKLYQIMKKNGHFTVGAAIESLIDRETM